MRRPIDIEKRLYYKGHRCPKCDGPLYFDDSLERGVIWVWCATLGFNLENAPAEYRASDDCDFMGRSTEL